MSFTFTLTVRVRTFLAIAIQMTAMSLSPAHASQPRQPVYAENGMVCAAQPLAVQVGVDILQQGGVRLMRPLRSMRAWG